MDTPRPIVAPTVQDERFKRFCLMLRPVLYRIIRWIEEEYDIAASDFTAKQQRRDERRGA